MKKETTLQLRLSIKQKETIIELSKNEDMSMSGFLWLLILKYKEEKKWK